MKLETITTLGELKAAGYQSKSIKDELRNNLREKIKSGKRFTHLSSFQKRIKYLPARKQQEILTKFESVYYLVNIK